jgi:catechol 2,3-dioxygenase-like lactoylglutathione lyase family enzyme
MASFEVTRAGAILAVSDFERSLAFYRDTLGLEVEAVYDEPPYATLVSAGARSPSTDIRRRIAPA